MKKAKVKKDAVNGVWDVIRPDGSTRWFYKKEDAKFYADQLNTGKLNGNTAQQAMNNIR